MMDTVDQLIESNFRRVKDTHIDNIFLDAETAVREHLEGTEATDALNELVVLKHRLADVAYEKGIGEHKRRVVQRMQERAGYGF